MLQDYPDAPFRIADDTTEQQRIDILQDLGAKGAKSPALDALAAKVWTRITALGDSSVRSVASEALNAIQHLEYHPHPVGIEQFQKVDYTLAHGGNCEDLSAALVALLMRLGVTARAVWIPQPDRDLNHVAVQVRVTPSEWVWADPSIAGAKLGEDPYAALRRLSPKLHPADLEFRAKRAYGMKPLSPSGQVVGGTRNIHRPPPPGSAPIRPPAHPLSPRPTAPAPTPAPSDTTPSGPTSTTGSPPRITPVPDTTPVPTPTPVPDTTPVPVTASTAAIVPAVSPGIPSWVWWLAAGGALGYFLGRGSR